MTNVPQPILRVLARSERALDLLFEFSCLARDVWSEAMALRTAERDAAAKAHNLAELKAATTAFSDLLDLEKAERLTGLLAPHARRAGLVGKA